MRRLLPVLQSASGALTRRVFLTVSGSLAASACSQAVGGDAQPDAQPDAQEAGNPDVGFEDAARPAADIFEAGPACRGSDVGAVESFPIGTRAAIGVTGIFVGRDSAGLWALELTCPHFGGVVQPRDDGRLYCLQPPTPDHEAIFDADGVKLEGPEPPPGRTMNLTNRAVSVCDRRVYVDRTREVPVGTRTAVA